MVDDPLPFPLPFQIRLDGALVASASAEHEARAAASRLKAAQPDGLVTVRNPALGFVLIVAAPAQAGVPPSSVVTWTRPGPRHRPPPFGAARDARMAPGPE